MVDPWTIEAHRLFKKHGVKTVGYVPDAGLTDLINSCEADNDIRSVVTTTEEEGIGLSAGAWLGGDKSAVLMQSSGVGNTVNAIASIISSCQFPLFMIVTMRGQYGESNPWQIPMGQAVEPVLKSLGVHVFEVETDEEATEAIEAGLKMAFVSNAAVAVLISQRLIGAKSFIADVAEEVHNVHE
ncbi:MAG: phosphonopyruvate decarboxylase [Rhodospirillaceae bacterium]|mgnify:CR=1 FL=1|nr:phosphonopyruvate decarboxylase [Rhodospirillaceae bacterium]|tara:strand:+ start:806 stop:1357 length:552 start_codon:yes stop_codon:yes gene_type:complete